MRPLLSDELIGTVIVLVCLLAVFVIWRCRDRVRVSEAIRESFQAAAASVIQVSGMTSIGEQLGKTTEAFRDMKKELGQIRDAIQEVGVVLKKQAGA